MFCMEGDSVAANLASVYNQSNNGDFVDALSYDPNYNETETPQVARSYREDRGHILLSRTVASRNRYSFNFVINRQISRF